MPFPYLFTIVVFIFLPTVLLWIFYGKLLRKNVKLLIFIAVFSFLWGLLFDLVGSVWWHIWFYNHTLGIYFLGLPIEEYLTLLIFPQQVAALLLVIREKIYG